MEILAGGPRKFLSRALYWLLELLELVELVELVTFIYGSHGSLGFPRIYKNLNGILLGFY